MVVGIIIAIFILIIIPIVLKINQRKQVRKQKNDPNYRVTKWLFLWLLTRSQSEDKNELLDLCKKLIEEHFKTNESINELKNELHKYQESSENDLDKYFSFEIRMLENLKEYAKVRYSNKEKETIIKSLIAIAMFDNKLDEGEIGFISKVSEMLEYSKANLENNFKEVYGALIESDPK